MSATRYASRRYVWYASIVARDRQNSGTGSASDRGRIRRQMRALEDQAQAPVPSLNLSESCICPCPRSEAAIDTIPICAAALQGRRADRVRPGAECGRSRRNPALSAFRISEATDYTRVGNRAGPSFRGGLPCALSGHQASPPATGATSGEVLPWIAAC